MGSSCSIHSSPNFVTIPESPSSSRSGHHGTADGKKLFQAPGDLASRSIYSAGSAAASSPASVDHAVASKKILIRVNSSPNDSQESQSDSKNLHPQSLATPASSSSDAAKTPVSGLKAFFGRIFSPSKPPSACPSPSNDPPSSPARASQLANSTTASNDSLNGNSLPSPGPTPKNQSQVSGRPSVTGRPVNGILRRSLINDSSTASNLRKFADLKATLFANCMSDKQLEELADLFQVQRFQTQQTVYFQNQIANMFYIVRSGELLVQVDKQRYTAQRQKSRFNLLKQMSRKSLAQAIDEDETQSQLTKSRRGSQFTFNIESTVAERTNPNPSPSYPINSPASSTNGSSSVDHDWSAENLVSLCIKSIGEFVGTDALQFLNPDEDEPTGLLSRKGEPAKDREPPAFHRDYTVISVNDSTCLGISRDKLMEFFSRYPELKINVWHSFAEFMETSLAKNSMFKTLTRNKIRLFSSLFRHNNVKESTVILTEGDKPTDFSCLYFIFSGSVEIRWTDDKNKRHVKLLHAGSTFGELGLLLDIQRTATAVAQEDCILFELTRHSLRHFLYLEPSLLQRARDKLEESQIGMAHLINHPTIQDAFFQFCEREHSTENLKFWRQAVEFRQSLDQISQEEATNKAREIVNAFVASSADQLINVSSSCRKNITDALDELELFPEQAHLLRGMFSEAEKEIFALMRADSFARFKSSALFKQAIEKLNSVDSIQTKPIGFVVSPRNSVVDGGPVALASPIHSIKKRNSRFNLNLPQRSQEQSKSDHDHSNAASPSNSHRPSHSKKQSIHNDAQIHAFLKQRQQSMKNLNEAAKEAKDIEGGQLIGDRKLLSNVPMNDLHQANDHIKKFHKQRRTSASMSAAQFGILLNSKKGKGFSTNSNGASSVDEKSAKERNTQSKEVSYYIPY